MTRRSRDELENGARNSPSREKGEIKENSDREKRERVFEIFICEREERRRGETLRYSDILFRKSPRSFLCLRDREREAERERGRERERERERERGREV